MENFDKTLGSLISKQRKKFRSRDKNFFFANIKSIMIQVLKALCYLHNKKICHFNISEESIMITTGDIHNSETIIAKLVGFGWAKTNVTEELEVLKNNNFRSFHEEFTAPEITYQNSHGLKTDIWDLGLVFLWMITGIKLENNLLIKTQHKK